jgi:hypothetical protein
MPPSADTRVYIDVDIYLNVTNSNWWAIKPDEINVDVYYRRNIETLEEVLLGNIATSLDTEFKAKTTTPLVLPLKSEMNGPKFIDTVVELSQDSILHKPVHIHVKGTVNVLISLPVDVEFETYIDLPQTPLPENPLSDQLIS